MLRVSLFCFVNLIFIIPNALCNKGAPCELSDQPCFLSAEKRLFERVMKGDLENHAKASDPLYQDFIEIYDTKLNITFKNVYMHGTKYCEVHGFKLDTETWELSLICPTLSLNADYEMYGDIESVHLEGKGKCEIFYDKYNINLGGGYETFTDETATDHLRVTYFDVVSIDIQGSASYKFDDLFNGDDKKSAEAHTYLNSNWKNLEGTTLKAVFNSMFQNFIINTNKVLALIKKSTIFVSDE